MPVAQAERLKTQFFHPMTKNSELQQVSGFRIIWLSDGLGFLLGVSERKEGVQSEHLNKTNPLPSSLYFGNLGVLKKMPIVIFCSVLFCFVSGYLSWHMLGDGALLAGN